MKIGRIIDHLATARRERQVSVALASLSERQLDDLGISRIDVMAARGR